MRSLCGENLTRRTARRWPRRVCTGSTARRVSHRQMVLSTEPEATTCSLYCGRRPKSKSAKRHAEERRRGQKPLRAQVREYLVPIARQHLKLVRVNRQHRLSTRGTLSLRAALGRLP
jgi:hypothetical protein